MIIIKIIQLSYYIAYRIIKNPHDGENFVRNEFYIPGDQLGTFKNNSRQFCHTANYAYHGHVTQLYQYQIDLLNEKYTSCFINRAKNEFLDLKKLLSAIIGYNTNVKTK